MNRLVPKSQLREEVWALARSIRDNALRTVAACKAAIQEVARPADRRNLDRVAALAEACFTSEDYQEG